MAHSYGGTTAIWKRPIRHHQPSEPAALCLLEASKAAGSPGWRSLRSILCYCLIFIDHFLAYMNIRRGYKIYTRVGDFDPPTHQPTNNYIVTTTFTPSVSPPPYSLWPLLRYALDIYIKGSLPLSPLYKNSMSCHI